MSKDRPVLPEDVKATLTEAQLKSAEDFYNFIIENRKSLESSAARGLVNVYKKHGIIDVENLDPQSSINEDLKAHKASTQDLIREADKKFKTFSDKRRSEGLSEAALAPLINYVEASNNKINQIFSSNQVAREAVSDFHIKAAMVNALPNFAVPITEEYRARGGMVGGEIAGTGMRTIDKQEKEKFKDQLFPLLGNLKSYKMENIIKGGQVAITELDFITRKRLTEHFADPLDAQTYVLKQNKFAENEEKFTSDIEGDFAKFQVRLEYIAQLQKRNFSQKIEDVQLKEILTALRDSPPPRDAINIVQKGGDIPKETMNKMDEAIAPYNLLLSAMKEVGDKREYTQRKDLMEALLPQIAEINPSDLEKNKKEITKLCARAIAKYSSKSLPLIGDNTVSVKDGNLDKMKFALETSLAKFHRIPEQDMDSRSLPSGMPLPSSRPVVDASKARVNEPNLKQSRPPQTPFPGTPSRPVSATPKSESPKVVTAKSLARWEQSELMPAGMPQTQTAQDKSIKKSSKELLLESKDGLRQELTQWEKNYKNGRNLPKPPSKNSDVGKSVQAWREWYNINTEALTTKGFNIPHNYKDVYEISSKHNTPDSLSILSALQKEARGRGEARSQAIVGKTSKAISVTPTTFGKEGVSINESEPSTPPPAPNAVQKKPKERIH